ncbi:hypothetical protein KXD40_006595 [Peronospora effusa]|uniref:Uncharacterized protein n=1 Tax=Peronospora effusa TaxID=542832 RepID=A0A3M6VER3_9STRA|nr:hypothetical protein DD238_007492 [Peronospora effusa]UIZ24656.1 hypothetical protein KXD40_006595 [Peronospora effusa]
MDYVAPTTHRQKHSKNEKNDVNTPDFRLIRRKRPRTPEIDHNALSTRVSPVKTPRLMMLPGLAELLAAQKQRNEGAVADASLNVLSCVSTANQEQEQQIIETEEEIELEDKTPWPSAKQYHDIFFTPRTELQIPVYDDLGVDPRGVPLHPEFIYSQPVSCMYFLKCSRLLGKGSFGFPRKKKTADETTLTSTSTGKKPAGKGAKKEPSKDFEWRKMSFVTGLPKKQPVVRYITATCYSRATDVAAKKKVFRMHAVMLADDKGTGEKGNYVLVHIRAGGCKRVGLRATLADAEGQALADAEGQALADAEGEALADAEGEALADAEGEALADAEGQAMGPASPDAHGIANAKQKADLLCMGRPVSPTSVAVSSYSSSTASTSPHNKKLLHAEFPSSQGGSSDHLTMALTGSPMKVKMTSTVTRHSLFTTLEDPNVTSARLALRDMILKSCTSPDEMAKYVMGLQEELAALQSQNQ